MEIVNGEESSIGVVTELATAKKMLATLLERYLSAVSVADTDTAKVARSNLNVIRAFINTKESVSQIAPKDEIGNEDQKDKGSTAKKDFEKKSGWFTTVIREIYDNGGNNTNWDAFVNKFTKKLGVKSNELNADVIREALRCIVRQKVEKGVSPLNVEMPCDDDMKNEFFKRMLMSPEHSGAFDFCIRKVLETDLNCKDVDEKMLIEVRKGLALRTALSTVDSYEETSEAFLQKLNQQSVRYRVEFTAEEKTNACIHVALMKKYRSKIAPILGLEGFKDLLRILKDMNTEAVNNQLDSYKKYVQDEPSKGSDSVSFKERKTIGQIKAKLKSFIACNLGEDPFNFRMKRYMNTMIEIMRSVLTDPNTDKNNVDALVKKMGTIVMSKNNVGEMENGAYQLFDNVFRDVYYNDQLKPNELSDLCDAMLSKVTEDMSQIPDGLSGGVKEPMSEAEKKDAMMVALLKKPMSEAEKDAMMVSRLKGRIELDSENLGKLAECLKAFVFRETALTPKVQQWLDKLDKDVDRSKAYAWLLQVSGEKWLAGVFKDCRMPKCDEIAIYNTLNNMTLDAYKPIRKN